MRVPDGRFRPRVRIDFGPRRGYSSSVKPPSLPAWLRYLACWLFGVSSAVFLTALTVPMYGRWNDGKPWMTPLILAAIPCVYGGVLGLGLPGRAPWALLLAGGAFAAPLALRGWPFTDALRLFAALAAAPAPAAALAAWGARRRGLSASGRLLAALALAVSTAGAFALADRFKWVPKTGIICEYPPGGFTP